MIAYFILVHRFPEQFKRLFRSIYQPGNSYVVHIDKSSGPELAKDLGRFLASYRGVRILPARNALWGGYSLVDAELRGMAALLQMDSSWTHYINLSGQDFPLKSQEYIRSFLTAHPDRQFIRAVCQRSQRPETLNRVSHYFVERFGRIFRTRIARKFLPGAAPFIGTQWKAVTRGFCEFVCADRRVARYKAFYQHSFIADEAFFQTVLMNHADQGEVVNDDLRMIDWVPDGPIKLRPRNFGSADIAALRLSPDLFARKFDGEEDREVLGLLEAHLKTRAATHYLAPAIAA
ncbi:MULTISPECIES: beta-1,6-N-acetylglucosaminyltransferase [unclassified Novosphingobium]|uniref:beta-1,6-N-acetylglucosaminyltransferase n=1 Tax=unclassified Novosphingobium TaxID=2644732 RepID=UPI000ED4CC82|nr:MULTISPECIES: beta-1,6-N-acetylglucosaminyltransferase [unclassified Novosphingobium]HCF25145.1 glycosyl transferase [Novosphingobium sp.]HQV03298.1 beta-1,6-N-acetylglucosaminyltransferase [Novosphingobium sp.]